MSPMPPHLAAAREKSRAAERAKDEGVAVEPPVLLLGLRKVPKGYEVVKALAPASTLVVVNAGEPMEFAAQSLLREIRKMLEAV